MNELENHNQDAQPNAGHEQDLDEMLDALNTEADQGRHTASFRPLIDFLKSHVQYLPVNESSSQHECPVCRETPSESYERMLQIDLPSCQHIFGADCFERYIQRSHTCPICREMWFEHRLSPETFDHEHVTIEVTLVDQQSAHALADRLHSDRGETVRRLLGERVTELDSSEEETEVTGQAIREYTESSSGGRNSLSGNSQVEATHVEITLRAGRGSRSDAETEREGSEVGVRAREVARHSGSDNEDLAPPRQRRRHE